MKKQSEIGFEVEALFSVIFFIAGSIAMLASPCVLIYQCVKWLEIGEWLPLPLSFVFEYFQMPYPIVEWRGIQKILNWGMDSPFSLFLLFLSFVFFFIGSKCAESETEK